MVEKQPNLDAEIYLSQLKLNLEQSLEGTILVPENELLDENKAADVAELIGASTYRKIQGDNPKLKTVAYFEFSR